MQPVNVGCVCGDVLLQDTGHNRVTCVSVTTPLLPSHLRSQQSGEASVSDHGMTGQTAHQRSW